MGQFESLSAQLSVLCDSAVTSGAKHNRRDAENAEIAQRVESDPLPNKLIACFVDLVIVGEFERRRFHDASSNCLNDLMRKGLINVDDFTGRF